MPGRVNIKRGTLKSGNFGCAARTPDVVILKRGTLESGTFALCGRRRFRTHTEIDAPRDTMNAFGHAVCAVLFSPRCSKDPTVNSVWRYWRIEKW